MQPTIIEIENKAPIVQTETFAPILYVMKYKKLDRGPRSCTTTCRRA